MSVVRRGLLEVPHVQFAARHSFIRVGERERERMDEVEVGG